MSEIIYTWAIEYSFWTRDKRRIKGVYSGGIGGIQGRFAADAICRTMNEQHGQGSHKVVPYRKEMESTNDDHKG